MTERLRQSIQSLESAIADLRQSIADRPAISSDIPSTVVEPADSSSPSPSYSAEDVAAIQDKITRAMDHIAQITSVSDTDKPEAGQ